MRAWSWWILAAALTGPACEMRDGVPEAPQVDEPSPADNRVTPNLEEPLPQEESFEEPRRFGEPESSLMNGLFKGHVLLAQAVTGPVEPVPPERPAPPVPGPAIGGSGAPVVEMDELEFEGPLDPDIAYGPSEDPPLAADPVPVRKNFAPEFADEGLSR